MYKGKSTCRELKKIRKMILILNLLLVNLTGFGQSKIIIDKYLINRTENNDISYQWTINGVSFALDTKEVLVYPHQNGLDTICFQETVNKHTRYDTIYSKIPDHTTLLMTIGCCDDGFDMVIKEKSEHFHQLCEALSLNADSSYALYLKSLEYGRLKFVVKNKPESDTLLFVCNPALGIGQMITVKKDYGWVSPCQNGYIDNIVHISVFKKPQSMSVESFEDDLDCTKGTDVVAYELDAPRDDIKSFGLRTFNKEQVIIQYDFATDEWQVFFTEP